MTLSLADRIEATGRLLEARCREAGMLVTGDGRVSENDAALLLCLAPGTLANMRRDGGAPAHFRTPMAGAKVTYRLTALAAWVHCGEA
jgi:hypothetical protein